MAGDPIKQAEEMLAEGVGLSEFELTCTTDCIINTLLVLLQVSIHYIILYYNTI